MILRAVEVEGKWYFPAKNEAGEDTSIADPINRCEPSKINAELKRRKRYVIWHPAREMRHPATGEEVALVGNVEDNGSGG